MRLYAVYLNARKNYTPYSLSRTGTSSPPTQTVRQGRESIRSKEIKICFGIGKHGDSATTRANKRSPWDTMHPGRRWAEATTADQMQRSDIENRIREQLEKHLPTPNRDTLFKLLSLE